MFSSNGFCTLHQMDNTAALVSLYWFPSSKLFSYLPFCCFPGIDIFVFFAKMFHDIKSCFFWGCFESIWKTMRISFSSVLPLQGLLPQFGVAQAVGLVACEITWRFTFAAADFKNLLCLDHIMRHWKPSDPTNQDFSLSHALFICRCKEMKVFCTR